MFRTCEDGAGEETVGSLRRDRLGKGWNFIEEYYIYPVLCTMFIVNCTEKTVRLLKKHTYPQSTTSKICLYVIIE